jgi:hypothetical protein
MGPRLPAVEDRQQVVDEGGDGNIAKAELLAREPRHFGQFVIQHGE